MVILLMCVGATLMVLLALVVTVVDVVGAPARRELAAQRRRAWECASEEAVARTSTRAAIAAGCHSSSNGPISE